MSGRLEDTPDPTCGNASIFHARLLYGTCAHCETIRSMDAVIAQMLLSSSAVYESVVSIQMLMWALAAHAIVNECTRCRATARLNCRGLDAKGGAVELRVQLCIACNWCWVHLPCECRHSPDDTCFCQGSMDHPQLITFMPMHRFLLLTAACHTVYITCQRPGKSWSIRPSIAACSADLQP